MKWGPPPTFPSFNGADKMETSFRKSNLSIRRFYFLVIFHPKIHPTKTQQTSIFPVFVSLTGFLWWESHPFEDCEKSENHTMLIAWFWPRRWRNLELHFVLVGNLHVWLSCHKIKGIWAIYYKSLTWFKAILGGIPLLNYHLGWPRLRSL